MQRLSDEAIPHSDEAQMTLQSSLESAHHNTASLSTTLCDDVHVCIWVLHIFVCDCIFVALSLSVVGFSFVLVCWVTAMREWERKNNHGSVSVCLDMFVY